MGNVTAKTSGEIASFMTPAKTNIKSLKVHFSPKQLGTGDPSPENVREIEGWDGVEGYGSGRNLLQNADGKISPLKLKKGTIITASSDEGGYFRGKKNGEWVTPIVWLNKTAKNGRKYTEPYTLPEDIDEGSIFLAIGVSKAQITLDGSIDYKPYQGNNISYQWKIPDEYQEVEYIESTGTQYIDTGVIGRPNIKVETDFELTDSTNISNCGLIGSREGSGEKRFYIISFYNNKWHLGLQGDITSSAYSVIRNQTQKVIFQNVDGYYSLTVNGTEIYNGNSTFSTTYPMYLFGVNNYGTVSRQSSFKLYTLKIQQDGNYIRNYIPCYCKSDGEIGLYDLISQTFYTNQGTGSFLKGNDVDKTFYGGYVDLISGELVEEYGKYIFTGDENIQWHGWGDDFYIHDYVTDSNTSLPFKSTDNTYCNMSIPVKNRLIKMPSGNMSVSGTNGTPSHTYIICSSYGFGETLEDCKAKLSELYSNGTPYTVVSELKDIFKKTHQLTPTQLSSFIGQNNFWSNADYVEIEYELKETEDIQKVRKKIILNQPHIESINGDIANFTTNMKAPLKECKVYFEPIQEGSGDPSPDNVRNIIGWDGVNVGLPDEYQEVEYIESTGTQYIKTDIKSRPIIEYESVLEFTNGSDQYTVGFRDGNFRAVGNGYYASKTQIAYNTTYKLGAHLSLNKKYKYKTCLKPNEQNVFLDDEMVASYDLPQTETVLSDKHVGIFCQLSNDTTPQFLSKIKLTSLAIKENDLLLGNFIPCYRKSDGEIGMYDTVSKTFYTNSGTGTFLKGDDVNTIIGNVNWSDEVGTVYGGYVDLAKGEVVAEYFGFIADGENIKTNSGYVNDTSYGAGIVYMDRYGFPDSDRLRVNTYCNTLNPIRSTSQNCVYWATNGEFYLVFYPFSKTTEESKASSEALEETNEWLKQHPTQIVYKLRTPIRYQLTPQQLLTFKGENNIWSDTNGQTEVKFWTH